ncbi:hypothetical protein [Catenuloplanes indicus]|uniref:Uncharacterized protein n=1 Tax=Catenuloplanes indicus TaxID=137267 RepID=A0AAE4AWT5_9ACTN|nr:hypothetical protein [Catenuloplanes indicus]MDQ0365389.1 hypothetical protein [Catenuloplanes indicus]
MARKPAPPAARVVMLRHPWGPALLGARPAVPPRLFAYYDGIVGTMTGGGLSHRLAHRAVHAFGTMALGFTQELFRPAAAGGVADVGRSRGRPGRDGGDAAAPHCDGDGGVARRGRSGPRMV